MNLLIHSDIVLYLSCNERFHDCMYIKGMCINFNVIHILTAYSPLVPLSYVETRLIDKYLQIQKCFIISRAYVNNTCLNGVFFDVHIEP